MQSRNHPSTPAVRNIAIVEDDAKLRRALELSLARSGYHPVLFDSAESFIESGWNEPVDCMLLDLRLPGINGVELLQRMREHGAAFPVIVLTGETNTEIEDQAHVAGATSFLVKGCTNVVLCAAIERALRRAR